MKMLVVRDWVEFRRATEEVVRVVSDEADWAVIDYLTREAAQPLLVGPTGLSGWRSSTGRGGGPGADPTSIGFDKTREFRACQLHAVSYVTGDSMEMRSVLKTQQQEDGNWSVRPLGGGGERQPFYDRPRLNIAGSWSASEFSAGGWVLGIGADEAHEVRLTFTNSEIVEDTVDNGIVLFLLERAILPPAVVEIFDVAGSVLATHRGFDGFAD